jgi:hypothetical protein
MRRGHGEQKENTMYLSKTNEMVIGKGRKMVWYFANNKGRGDSNCTIFIVDEATERQGCVKEQKRFEFFASTRTSSWAGNINLSKRVKANLGIADVDICGVR